MVDFHALSTADFASLDTAANAWTTVAQKLRAMDEDWKQTVTARFEAGSDTWSGAVADLARPKLAFTNQQLTAAAGEADAFAKVFRDAATEFRAARAKLDKTLTDAHTTGLTVTDTGAVTWPRADAATRHDVDGYSAYLQEWQPKAEAARRAIDAAVAEATAADERLAALLTTDAKTDATHTFNSVAAFADADRAAALLRKGGDISDTELAELTRLLDADWRDPAFSTRFYQDLGPDGLTSALFGMLGDPKKRPGGPKDPRWAAYNSLQDRLGLALATATRQTNEPHLSDDWAAAFRKAGTKVATPYPPPNPQLMGYQLLAPLLTSGDYDPHFIIPIAEHITQLDAGLKGNWPLLDIAGMAPGSIPITDQPTTDLLTALAHSPAASNEFFTSAHTAYNSDGTVNADPNAKHRPADYLDYYVHEKDWQDIATDPDNRKNRGVLALGSALESATKADPLHLPATGHDQHEADLMKRVVGMFGTQGGDGALGDIMNSDGKLAALKPSLARMSADYIADVQRAMVTGSTLPNSGYPVAFDSTATKSLLEALGRDPDSYAIVANANQGHTAAVLREYIAGADKADLSLVTHVKEATYYSGVVDGHLSESRVIGVHDQHIASDQAYNDALDRNGGYAKTGFEKALGLVPHGDKLTAPADKIFDMLIESNKIDTTQVAVQDGKVIFNGAGDSLTSGVQQAITDAAGDSRLSPADIQALITEGKIDADTGFSKGAAYNLVVNAKGSH
ncbi:hypothetical protein [Streptomyces sp. NRRL WC-3742]|uniref:hypothetical protein n=1 Tax=Streptomyces sp. NRRL WC-3742 TaxID=1463934 RepID=UPI0004C92A15|nr:hypothetical protein [Streptomyces sp. NRRL WC-3742]